MDAISFGRLQKLHPKLREEAIQLFDKAEKALTGRARPRITFTLRTMAEQQALYDQGRTKPGPIVTNAKPGTSYHNWGLAFDFALILDGKEVSWSTTADFDGDHKADWMEVVKIFKDAGWSWGGDWKSFKDMPHLEKTLGLHWSQCQRMYATGQMKDGYVNI